MVISREDWLKDTAWYEAHLTPQGWLAGTRRTEKGRYENEREPPDDRVMTVRCLEKIPAGWDEKPRDWSEIKWVTNDLRLLEHLQKNWGVLPRHAPALGAESAMLHLTVPNVRVMTRSARDRPAGALARGRGYALGVR